jgi:hypothetical protein
VKLGRTDVKLLPLGSQDSWRQGKGNHASKTLRRTHLGKSTDNRSYKTMRQDMVVGSKGTLDKLNQSVHPINH